MSAGADAAGASAGVCSELVSILVPMQSVELKHRMVCSGLVSAQVPMQFVERMQLTAGGGGIRPHVGGDLLGGIRCLNRSGVPHPLQGTAVTLVTPFSRRRCLC